MALNDKQQAVEEIRGSVRDLFGEHITTTRDQAINAVREAEDTALYAVEQSAESSVNDALTASGAYLLTGTK